MRQGTLGIIAGGGPVPAQLAAAVAATGRPIFVLALDGHADRAALAPFPHAGIRLGAVGAGLAHLRAHGVTDLVLVGTVRRPSLLTLMPDAEGARLIARIGRAAFAGDDGLLAAIVRVLEEEGFRVHGVHDVMAGLTAPEGVLTARAPSAADETDILRGAAVCRLLGEADVGQAVVVQQGLVLGVEAIEGTDALLARCAALRRDGPGGVLVKRAKPGQELRADLPTIGVRTVEGAAAAGLVGIAVEAGRTLMPERAATIAAADARGLFLVARRFTP
ncbi:LpxI family protein [Elioraea sp. Yellowstone]|uniref:LpxI family protein n=1 Tax=Elioraea sp. Yellowstone TaxID=2592070 RepID=UPI00114E598F|nr:UDP-2,3-diacylglucosamine diphosphatase LpxI [Elioraea sp. Yellowstone]TQF79407.1 LpxI family protein [Elioraea sp. Yellowstone]